MSDTLTPDAEKGKTFAALVRIHESNCSIPYPHEEEQRFRIAIMRKLAKDLGLREFKGAVITGPDSAKGVPRPKDRS
jgi:hypothetical protein